tara:strand:- start:949 stop:1587 length:639 start_codon:yes stop_codon:yes gene_type:complete
MNGKIDEGVFKEVCKYINFSNIGNNIKKRDNKKGVYKRRIFKNDSEDLLTQLTLLFYNKICINDNNNNVNRDEIIELRNANQVSQWENEKLNQEIKKLKKELKEANSEIDECYVSIDNLYKENNTVKNKCTIVDKPNIVVDESPSVFDDLDTTLEITDYDPYNQVYDDIPNKLSDYNSYDIYDAMNYHSMGTDEWNKNTDNEKIQLINNSKN